MAISLWHTFPLLLLALLGSSSASPSTSFENTAIVRTVELGGSVVHVTTTYAIKAIEAGTRVYTIALGLEEKRKTSWLEAKVKGQQSALTVTDHGFDANQYVYAQLEATFYLILGVKKLPLIGCITSKVPWGQFDLEYRPRNCSNARHNSMASASIANRRSGARV
jgi:hypothetical protein